MYVTTAPQTASNPRRQSHPRRAPTSRRRTASGSSPPYRSWSQPMTSYPAGTIGQRVAAADDDRQVAALAVAPFVTVALDDVTGLAIGMTLTFIVNTESRIIETIDDTVTPPTVTLVDDLSGAPVFPSVVTALGVDDRQEPLRLCAVRTVALDSVDDLAEGMTLTFNVPARANRARVIDAIDAIATPPTVTLRTALSGRCDRPRGGDRPCQDLTAMRRRCCIRGAERPAGHSRRRRGAPRAPTRSPSCARWWASAARRRTPVRIILEQPLGTDHPPPSPKCDARSLRAIRTRQPVVPRARRRAGADELLVTDGTSYAIGDVARFTLPDTSEMFHRLAPTPSPRAHTKSS